MQSKERQFIVYIESDSGRESMENAFGLPEGDEVAFEDNRTVTGEECSKENTGIVLSCLRDRGVDMSAVLVCRNNGIFSVDDEDNDVAPRKNIPAKVNMWDSWVVHNITMIPSEDTAKMLATTQITQGREDSRLVLQRMVPTFARFASEEDEGAVLIDEFYWAGGSSTFVMGLTDAALSRLRSNKRFRESHGTVHERELKDTQMDFAGDIEWMLKQAVK